MGVYIKGMEMPKTGEYRCVIRKWQQGGTITIDLYGEEELSGTIVPIAPHGRLIDADALASMYDPNTDFGRSVRDMITDCPTIIPAEPFNNLSKPCKDDDDIPICAKASPASLGIYKKAEEGK